MSGNGGCLVVCSNLGERLANGARREIREECKIEVEIQEMVATFEPIQRDEHNRVEYHYVVIDFWARLLSGEAVAQDDAADLAWTPVTRLGSLPALCRYKPGCAASIHPLAGGSIR